MSKEEFEKLIERMTKAIATDQFRRILAAGGMELPEGQDALAEKFARAAAEAIGLKPGMVVVSAEPTEEMVERGHYAFTEEWDARTGEDMAVVGMFRAMLAAAARPQPASAG